MCQWEPVPRRQVVRVSVGASALEKGMQVSIGASALEAGMQVSVGASELMKCVLLMNIYGRNIWVSEQLSMFFSQ